MKVCVLEGIKSLPYFLYDKNVKQVQTQDVEKSQKYSCKDLQTELDQPCYPVPVGGHLVNQIVQFSAAMY